MNVSVADDNPRPIRPAEPVWGNVPKELTSKARWVLWRWELRAGKWTKAPLQPDGSYASSTDPATWSQFDLVQHEYHTSDRFDGIGFVLDGSGLIAWDLDYVVEPDDSIRENQDPDARSLADRLINVAQLVVSGLGLHAVGPALFERLTGRNDLAGLFRAGLGLRGPLSRAEASGLADDAERQLRGPIDYTFGKRILLARLLDRLVQCAHDVAEELRAEGLALTAGNLETKLIFAVGFARPPSDIVPLGVTMLEVERAIPDAVRFYLDGARRR